MDKRKKRIVIISLIACFILVLLYLLRVYAFPLDIKELVDLRDRAYLILVAQTVASAVLLLMSFERNKVLNLCIALSFFIIVLFYFADIKYTTISNLYFVPFTVCLVVLLIKRWVDKRTAVPTVSTTINEASSITSAPEMQETSDEGDF